MEDGEADLFGFFGDAGAEGGAAESYAAAAGGEKVVGVAGDVEAEEIAGLGGAAEHGADGVVGADVLEIEAGAGDETAVDFGSGADLWDVGFGFFEEGEEVGFEGGCGWAEEVLRELDDAAGVGDDLHGFEAGDIVEEPAAGGVHELGVAFELEEFEENYAFSGT